MQVSITYEEFWSEFITGLANVDFHANSGNIITKLNLHRDELSKKVTLDGKLFHAPDVIQ